MSDATPTPGPPTDAGAASEADARRHDETLSLAPGAGPIGFDGPAVPARLGPYEIRDELGRGGMGCVFRALDTRLDREVALKLVPRGEDATHREMVQRFRREAQAAGRLADHPNIVGVHDVGETGDFLYLAMDLVDGVGLDAALADGDLGFARIAELLEQACRATQHAHDHGVLHRDIKPGNILVEHGPAGPATGMARLADFGLAESHGGPELTRLTQTGTVLGTPAYMPPEQAQGEGCEPRSDVYALGATLYHALVGGPPFEGETLVGLLMQVVDGELVPPRRRNPGIPRALDAVVCKAMAREAGQRYASAGAMAADLARFRRGDAVLARPGAGVRGLGRWLGRHPVAAGLTAAACVAAAATIPLWRGGRAEGRERSKAIRSTSAATDAAERAGRISAAYYQLSLATRDDMARLEDAWHGVPTPPTAVADALAHVRSAADAVRAAGVGVADAWVGLAQVYAGQAPAGLAAIAAARAAAPDDPFPHILAARVELGRYAAGVGNRNVSYGTHDVHVLPIAESPESAAARRRAEAALTAGLGEGLWAGLEHGAEQRRLGAAVARLAQADYAAAVEGLRPLVDDALIGGDAASLLAAALIWLDRYEEAAQALEPLVRRGWADAMDRSITALIAVGVENQGRGQEPDAWYQRAIRMADLLCERRPDDPAALDGRGLARAFLARAQRARGVDARPLLAQALGDLDRLVALAPENALTLHARGMVSMDQGIMDSLCGQDPLPAFRRALDDIDAALARDPQNPDWIRARADLLFQLGQATTRAGGDPMEYYAAARAALEPATHADPDDATVWHALGNVQRAIAIEHAEHRGDPFPALAASIAAYDRAVATTAAPAFSLTGRGAAYALKGEYEQRVGRDPDASFAAAIADFDAALAHNPAHASAWGNRGNVWNARALAAQARGRDPLPALARAVADYTGALERNPTHPGFLHNRAVAWLHTARWQARQGADPSAACAAVIDDCTAAIRIAADRPQAYWTRSAAYQELGDLAARGGGDGTAAFTDALADLRHTLQWWDRRAMVHVAIGSVCERLERWGEAVIAFRSALTLEPGDASVRRRLAAATARAGG